MTILKSTTTLAVFGALVMSCGKAKTETKDNQRGSYDPEAAKVQVDVTSAQKEDGSVAGLISFTSANTQVLRVNAELSFKGTALYFPPASFDIDQEVGLSAFKALAHRANVKALIDDKTQILGIGPSVQITWTYDQDTFVPYTIEMPVPGISLGLTEDNAESANGANTSLVVFYLKNDPVQQQYVLGYLPPSELTYKNGSVWFKTTSYGVYQPAWIDTAPAGGKSISAGSGEIVSEDPPAGFSIEPLTAKLYSKTAKITWELADLATNYEVVVSSKDSVCSVATKTYSGLLNRSKTVEFTADGDHWICVFAKNTGGKTPAKNNGIKVSVDQTPPPAPDKPASVGGNDLNTVNLRFSWNAVTDVGPAGIRHYFLQVGSTPGGSDHFNSIVQEPSQFISATNGDVYYARVKVIDNAGNESEWSPVSDKVTVNTD